MLQTCPGVRASVGDPKIPLRHLRYQTQQRVDPRVREVRQHLVIPLQEQVGQRLLQRALLQLQACLRVEQEPIGEQLEVLLPQK